MFWFFTFTISWICGLNLLRLGLLDQNGEIKDQHKDDNILADDRSLHPYTGPVLHADKVKREQDDVRLIIDTDNEGHNCNTTNLVSNNAWKFMME